MLDIKKNIVVDWHSLRLAQFEFFSNSSDSGEFGLIISYFELSNSLSPFGGLNIFFTASLLEGPCSC